MKVNVSHGSGLKCPVVGIPFFFPMYCSGRDSKVIPLASRLNLRTLAIMCLAIGTVALLTFILTDLVNTPFLSLLFEAASALGTIGFSDSDSSVLTLSAALSDFGKVLILSSMLPGGLYLCRSGLCPPHSARSRALSCSQGESCDRIGRHAFSTHSHLINNGE